MASTSIQQPPNTPAHPTNPIPSSSPAFATPAIPLPQTRREAPQRTSTPPDLRPASPAPRAAPILPILLPPGTLRPIAFRTFTKKHNLTLTSSALQALSGFVGRHCGAGWREEGLAEMVLDEVARSWKKADGKVIVDAEGDRLKGILKQLEGSMVGGRIVYGSGKGSAALNRQDSGYGGALSRMIGDRPGMERNESQDSLGMSTLEVDDDDDNTDEPGDVRSWLKIVGAFDMPRLVFNPARKHFEHSKAPASFLPSPLQKTEAFRQRYHLIHQRLLRNESFQAPTVARDRSALNQSWKVTSIANLLGRSGSGHLLLGMLAVAPTGTLAISDLTGSIALDLEQATPIDDIETWLCPGMIVLVDGVYEEEHNASGGQLAGVGGVGGTIGGRFVGFSIGAPRCETRAVSLGLSDMNGTGDTGTIGGGFGWVDFLGVGSERAVGTRMRRLEQRILGDPQPPLQPDEPSNAAGKVIFIGQACLDNPRTLPALRRLFTLYSSTASTAALPTAFVLFGSFTTHAALSSNKTSTIDSNDTSSIAYKEHFDSLASLLADFPTLLRHCTFVFVPGDNDAWSSAFAAGAAPPLPKHPVPDMFTTRIRRAFAAANASVSAAADSKHPRTPGAPTFTTNPSRLSLFGPAQELVLFRDDASGRLRRNAIPYARRQHQQDQDQQQPDAPADPSTQPDASLAHARRLTKTLLDQSHLSPFAPATRPVHWAHAASLTLYPLPTALALCDADAAPFALVYQGCCVLNAGALVGRSDAGRERVRWVEYDCRVGRAGVREGPL